MINDDEGTLAYCAAKIASEIEQDPRWGSPRLDVNAGRFVGRTRRRR